MGILDALLGRTGVRYEVRHVGTSADILGYTVEQMYRSQPALRSVVGFISDNVASIPLKCYVRESDTSRIRDTEGVLPTLLRFPNGHMTGHELMRQTVSDIELYGYCVWVVVPSTTSRSGWAIEPVPAPWVDVRTRNGLGPSGYRVVNPYSNRTIELDVDDVLLFGQYSPGGMGDASPVSALKQVLAEQVSAWQYRNGVWRNGGRISQVIERPMGADWDPQDRERFARSWKSRFAGNDGTDTGGTPILEDGMRLVSTQFNAREAEWAEATRLAREDVAAVYHINPSLIWHTDAQTYASAKDNARALYAETLSPILDMLSERMNAFLLPKVGADPREYVEFDISKKLEASFEEQASVLQSSTGAPWLTRNEARARLNLPPIDGADELIVPLNVVEGGLASPNAEPYGGYVSAEPDVKAKDEPEHRVKARPETRAAMDMASVLRAFFKRQRRKVLPSIDRAKSKDAKDDWPGWWDAGRWDRELAADLEPVLLSQATASAKRALRSIGMDPSEYDEDRTRAYIRAMAEGKARAVNNVTFRQLKAALDDDLSEGAEGATPEGVYDKAETSRADSTGLSFATAAAGFGSCEAVNQRVDQSRYRAMKTWVVTSGNPRAEHAAMDGETVPIGEPFSNGAMYPGDQALTPEESCGCQCQVEITIWRL